MLHQVVFSSCTFSLVSITMANHQEYSFTQSPSIQMVRFLLISYEPILFIWYVFHICVLCVHAVLLVSSKSSQYVQIKFISTVSRILLFYTVEDTVTHQTWLVHWIRWQMVLNKMCDLQNFCQISWVLLPQCLSLNAILESQLFCKASKDFGSQKKIISLLEVVLQKF